MSPRAGFSPSRVATAIQKRDTFAKDDTGRLYVFQNGVFIPGGEDVVKTEDWRFFERVSQTDGWRQGEVRDVLALIRINAVELWSTPPSDVLNVRNGLLDLNTRTLHEHTPEHRSTIQIPVVFDPEVSCPVWDRFLREVLPGNEDLAWELAGSLLVPESPVQCIHLLYGPGGNGKSTLLDAFEALIGPENTSHVSLQDLATDSFASSQIYGKLANICGDLPLGGINDTALIKRLTGGDTISAQFKHQNRFEFKSFATQIFSANHYIKVNDSSPGFWDRMLIVPMEKSFRKSSVEVPQASLLAGLRDPRELSGALNKALDGLDRLNRNMRFSESPRGRELLEEMRGQPSPIKRFLQDRTRQDSMGRIETREFVNEFNAWARDNGHAAMTPSQFGRELAKAGVRVQKTRRGRQGAQKACYEGLTLKNVA